MSSATLWSRLVRTLAGVKTHPKSINRPMRASPVLESLEGRVVPAAVILNPTGGLVAGDGIRTLYDQGQFMVYKENQFQLYYGGFNGIPNEQYWNAITLTIGDYNTSGKVIGYLSNRQRFSTPTMTGQNWTQVTNSAVTTNGASSYFTSSLSYTDSAGTYVVDLRVDYTSPNNFMLQTYTVTIPAGNTKDVRLYSVYDTYLGGSDAGPGFIDNTGSPTANNGIAKIGVYGQNITESIDYVSGIPWESYASESYSVIVFSSGGGNVDGVGRGTPLSNNIDSNPLTDNGIGVNWNFGSTPGAKAPVAYNFVFNAPQGQGPIDTTPPSTPLITSISDDTGVSPTDQCTKDNALVFTGTAEANSTVKVFNGTTLIGTTTASATGDFSVNVLVLPDGTYPNFTVTATDTALNQSAAATVTPWTIDTVAPVVDMVVDSTDSDGTYRNGTLTFELTFDEMVYVSGVPSLNLNSGGLAQYVSGSGTNTLVFTYLIQPGESTPDEDYLSVLGFDLTNGSITDCAGNIPAVLLSAVPNGNLDANNQLIIRAVVGVTLVPYAGSFIDNTVTPGSGKTNLASLSYLATFDEVVDNFPRQAFQTSGLLLTSVHRIADGTGLHWKIDAKPTNPLGTVGFTSIQVVASTFTDVLINSNLASNVVTVDVFRNMKMTSSLSVGANSAKVIGRVTTLSGLSVTFSGPVDPATVVASAFNTYNTGAISNIVVAANRLSATFDLNINNGGTAFNGMVRFNVIDKAIEDEYGNKVKGSTQLQWTYDGQGATAVFGSSAAARVRAGQQIEWTVKFSEAVAFSKNNLTVTIGGVTVNSSQISVRGSGSSYTVTLKTTTALKGALVVAMKSGSAGPLDLRGNQMAVIPSNLAKTTII